MIRRPARQCRGEAVDAAAPPAPRHGVRMHLPLMCLCCAGVGRAAGPKGGLLASCPPPLGLSTKKEDGWEEESEASSHPSPLAFCSSGFSGEICVDV